MSAPRQKYRNHAQLVQGVSQVCDPTLSQGERLFLNALAAFNVQSDPHPGNEKLMVACGVGSRQGVNYIANKLVKRELIGILQVGNGRGKATVYRIRVEDSRFPYPQKYDSKPTIPDLLVSTDKPASDNLSLSTDKPASISTQNPQVSPPETPETRKSELAYGFKPSDTNTDTEKIAGVQPSQEGPPPNPPPTTPIDIFWENYPTAKNFPSIPRSVRRAWSEIAADNHLGEILFGLERWKKSERWETEQFIKDPANFLADKIFLISPPSSRPVKPAFDHRRLKRL